MIKLLRPKLSFLEICQGYYYYSTNYSLYHTTSKQENTSYKLYSKMFDRNFHFSDVFMSQIINPNTSQLDLLYHLYLVVHGPITIC